ncbi:hypothetical protein SBRCBS47491_006050 [Sporothrix bragantina]|uniref:SUN domain protein (Adg3) n=1 Tax=Sporothrix bragantina TaxID=671064 RepID=A0ABP0C2N6_9PEZI
MKLSALTTSALVLGVAQPALGELHGHRMAHVNYGKRNVHNHNDAALLKPREPEASQPEVHQHEKRQSQTIESLPALFTRDSSSPLPPHVAARDHAGDIPKDISKRAVCKLPNDPDLYAVPGASNGGWAMAPDVQCTAGSWCPIACVSGKVMAQWKPGTTYTYPQSMYGGLYCGSDGTPVKSFDSQPYCVEGTGTVSAVNKCGSVVSFCQTVLPGDEGMYIPTDVTDTSVLAVPGPSYWDGTAAHYYVNPPGTNGETGCIWGTDANMIGNWAPYVAGANTDSSGLTYVKIAWNPVYTASGLSGTKPTFGLRIECSGSGCNGTPCEINADNAKDFSVTSADAASGAGGADFCVVTVPKGGSANIVAFNFDGSSSSGSSSTSGHTSTSSSSTSTSKTSTTSTTSSSTTSSSSSTSSSKSSTLSSSSSSSSSLNSNTHKAPTSKTASPTTFAGGIFHENGTVSTGGQSTKTGTVTGPTTGLGDSSSTATQGSAGASSSSKSEAVIHNKGGAAVAGLIVAVVAGLWLY